MSTKTISVNMQTPRSRASKRRLSVPFLTLEEAYASDPVLLALYMKKLPKRGWAGKTTPMEREYIRRYKAAQEGGDHHRAVAGDKAE